MASRLYTTTRLMFQQLLLFLLILPLCLPQGCLGRVALYLTNRIYLSGQRSDGMPYRHVSPGKGSRCPQLPLLVQLNMYNMYS